MRIVAAGFHVLASATLLLLVHGPARADSPPGFLLRWGTIGSGDGQFAGPAAVAADIHGNIYVADELNHRIQKFTGNGTFLSKWGSQGSGPGQFN